MCNVLPFFTLHSIQYTLRTSLYILHRDTTWLRRVYTDAEGLAAAQSGFCIGAEVSAVAFWQGDELAASFACKGTQLRDPAAYSNLHCRIWGGGGGAM
jgi:dienelactone hydrolase